MRIKRFWISLIAGVFLAACQAAPVLNPTTVVDDEPEIQVAFTPASEQDGAIYPADDWAVSSPEAQGLDSAMLAEMINQIIDRDISIDGMVIVRNGVMVLEAYFDPYDGSEQHIIHSCTKSIVSTLIGIAIDQGFIENVDQSIWDFFPEIDTAEFSADKQAITIRHLLSMSSGLDCRDSYKYNWGGLREMKNSENWSHYFLALPSIHEPGTYFEYCNGGSYMLASILKRATGESTIDFAHDNLFGPLGIEPGEWPLSPEGVNEGWGSLYLYPQDMARFGYLYLNEGIWAEEQIISAEYVQEATSSRINAATIVDDYGFQWWIDKEGYYMALGYMGQYIFVIPEHDLVVAFVSNLADNDFHLPENYLKSHILESILADDPLPENEESFMFLQKAIDTAGSP